MFTWQQQFTIMTKITQIMKYSVLHTVLDNYSSDLVIAQGFKNFENTKIKKEK